MKSEKDFSVKKSFLGTWFATLQMLLPSFILSGIAFIVYFQSFHYPFQFDDIANITKYFHIRNDNPFSNLGRGRWFSNWLNCLNYKIGKFDPFTYRMFNLFIHIVAGIALFVLIYNLCRMIKNRPFFYDNAYLLATVTSGLFLLHPVQTQTVSYVIQARLEGIAGLFVLLSLCFFVGIFRAQKRWAKALCTSFFILFSFVSCATKEIVIVIPFLALLIDWFFVSKEEWSVFKKHLLWYGLFTALFVILLAKYIGTHFLSDIVKFKAVVPNNRGNVLTDHAMQAITSYDFFISQFKVIWHYALIFFWPLSMGVDYDWKLSKSFFAMDSIVPFIGLMLLLLIVFNNVLRKKWFAVNVGILWFLIAIAPRSSIIPAPELICDYKTYLASVGLFFLIATWVVHLVNKIYPSLEENALVTYLTKLLAKKERVIVALLMAALVPVGYAAFERNKVWRSSLEFWGDGVKKAPNKARVHNNYGVALAEAGRTDEAIIAYKKAIALDPYYQDPLSNIAVAYSVKGDLEQAVKYLRQAIYLSPEYPEAYNNLGSLLTQKGDLDQAEAALKKAISLRPWYGKAYYNLARLSEVRKQPEKVWEYLKKAMEGDLDIPEVFFKYGLASLVLNKHAEAERAFSMVVKIEPYNKDGWFNLANVYYLEKKYDQAQGIYEKLVKEYPVDVRFTYNLAETVYTKGDYAKALHVFKKSISLPKPVGNAFIRISQCLEKLGNVQEAKGFLEQLLQTPDIPAGLKKVVNNEVTRLTLQTKLNEGKGSIKLSELNAVLQKKNERAGKKS